MPLNYVATARHRYTMHVFLRDWAPVLRSRVRVLAYEELFNASALPNGAWIFSDLERLRGPWLAATARLCRHLKGAGALVLNDPRTVLTRQQLLERLGATGVNDFRVHTMATAHRARWPVFIRHRSEHQILSGLVTGRRHLLRASARAAMRGTPPFRQLVVEYLHTAERGTYTKCASFVSGETVTPRHLIRGRDWQLKTPDILDERTLRDERRFLEANEYRAWVLRMFKTAGIQYGRLDFSAPTGRPQLWEINTNPVLLLPRWRYERRHLTHQEWFASRIIGVLALLADKGEEGASIAPLRDHRDAPLRYISRIRMRPHAYECYVPPSLELVRPEAWRGYRPS